MLLGGFGGTRVVSNSFRRVWGSSICGHSMFAQDIFAAYIFEIYAEASQNLLRCPSGQLSTLMQVESLWAEWLSTKSTSLSVRPTGSGDMAFLADLYASTRMEELAQTNWPEAAKRDFLNQQFLAQHQHYMRHYAGARWLIVECDAAAAGRLYFVHWPREIRIIDIALMPEARGKGFGTALLEDIIDEAISAGKAISIHVDRMNPALSLYRRLGFQEIEDKGVYLLMEHPGGQADPTHTII